MPGIDSVAGASGCASLRSDSGCFFVSVLSALFEDCRLVEFIGAPFPFAGTLLKYLKVRWG